MPDPKIPERIGRLEELAGNLWWSWHPQARNVFRLLDYQLWKLSGHNPVRELHEVRPETLKTAIADPFFLSLYDSVMAAFDADMSDPRSYFTARPSYPPNRPLAYFSMEYAIHNSLPIYAGGLGVLAGDICKEASDLGLPTVAIGFMYPQGYFYQRLCASTDSCQQEVYEQLDFSRAPISRVLSPRGDAALARVSLDDTTLAIAVWQVKVGGTSIYLLDTNLEPNPEPYRELSARLYVADREQRLQQEIVLGIGGVRVLRALGINPVVWHANEGHTAFMMLERVREEVAGGASFTEAAGRVQATTVFTTHTPVLAGHDVFPVQLVEKYLANYGKAFGDDRREIFRLGQHESYGAPSFNMTLLAMRLASQRTAVSRRHGEVTRRMWHGLWPDLPEEKVPISHITNGIHVPTWIAPELHTLFEKYLGKNWARQCDDAKLWERLAEIPDEDLWSVHQVLKGKLLSTMRVRARMRWAQNNGATGELPATGTLLDPEVLTIAFARRFVGYKRPMLIFRDIERLKRIVNNDWHPVQIIFAGKSHPADLPSKALMQQVYSIALNHEFQGRIAFVENYDMHLARYLVQGVDVWLNTPRRLQEASGTSGMKASLNGVLQLSVRDGWWHEGYNGHNGWAIGGDEPYATPAEEDSADADSLYRLLEEKIVPLYYARDRRGTPHGWIGMVKEAMRTIVPVFNTRRMLKEYNEKMYRPALPHPESA